MRLLRAETLRLRGWAPKSGWLAWRNYDFQLTTYAVLLTLFGLAMAYSNSVGADPRVAVTLGSPFVRSAHVGGHRGGGSRPDHGASTTSGFARSRGRSTSSTSACSF